MTESTSVLNTPVLWINTYLQEKLGDLLDIGVPFFPPKPFNIDDLTEQWVILNETRIGTAGVAATWDRMFRMRRGPFPHIKCEQVLYYFYGLHQDSVEVMVKVQESVLRLMDRGDESAQELNAWAKAKSNAGGIDGMSCKFYFHNFKIYQLEEARDIIDFGTARTYAGNKIIIDYDYHQHKDIVNP
jgi:hypothetical protein